MRWLRAITPWAAVEIFAAANLAFLALDVYIAHEVNAFERPQEWVPIAFSLAAPLLLIVGAIARRTSRALGFVVGWVSLIIGIAGMIFHLQSHFFEEQTIRNLVYTAPFIAPLAYAGIGMLLVLDRMVEPRSIEWSQWVLFLALGGFAGNFVLSLADHAQNGFFNRAEWVPVVASAFAVAFLLLLVLRPADGLLLRWSAWIMAIEALVGIAGFLLHIRGDVGRTGPMEERFLYGAPLFAPLLFANLAILAGIGMWGLRFRSAAACRRFEAPESGGEPPHSEKLTARTPSPAQEQSTVS